MDYKFAFFLLAVGVIGAGAIPFGISQQNQVEPSMEIDMLFGQTQFPFRIQDSNNQNVFAVTAEGGLDPRIVEVVTTQFDTEIMDEIHPLWHYSEPATVITETAESGAGVYQFTYTVTAEDVDESVDSRGMFLRHWQVPIIMVQMENTGAGTISASWSVWDATNDFEIMSDVTDATVETGNFVSGYYADTYSNVAWSNANIESYRYEAGDVIGLKIWTNTSGDLRINKVAISGIAVLEVDALNIALKENREPELGNEWDDSEPITCPFSLPTTCSGENLIRYTSMYPANNLMDWGTDADTMTMGSWWFPELFLGSLTDGAVDSMPLFDDSLFFSYPDSVNLVRWK